MMFKATAAAATNNQAAKAIMESETDDDRVPGSKSPEFVELSESFISREKASAKRTQSRNNSDMVKSPTFSKEEIKRGKPLLPPRYESESETY